jgi:hypothetical protein
MYEEGCVSMLGEGGACAEAGVSDTGRESQNKVGDTGTRQMCITNSALRARVTPGSNSTLSPSYTVSQLLFNRK